MIPSENQLFLNNQEEEKIENYKLYIQELQK